MCNVANPTHLRYLNLDAGEEDVSLPQVLSKFCHLQVLDVGSNTDLTISNGVNNLVSLRHLVAEEGACSFIVSSVKMTSLQELDNFMVDNSSGFEIKQLQSMNELVQLGVSQLENVKTREETYEAGLTNKQHLGELHLSWSQHEYGSDMSSEPSGDIETEEESSPMDDSGPSSEPSRDTTREVLEGLEPHHNLKHLQISGYDGATSPEWLATSLTSLQTLHLERCGKWRILPSLERLLFLRKLELRNMRNVTEVLLPSLEELVLIKMPKLERCSCTSVRDLNSSLRVLKIKMCPVLKVFPLFESSQKFKIEQKSLLSSLGELIIHECPQLLVPHPLPPSTTVSKLSISRVSTLPTMEVSSSGTLRIGASEYSDSDSDLDSDELRTLDGKMLSFQNLRFLTHLTIAEHTHEDMAAADCNALPSLERLYIASCGITGKWLSVMLRHLQALEELVLMDCPPMVEEEEISRSNLISAREAWSTAYPNDELISLAPEGLLRIPLNVISSLKEISIYECPYLTFYRSKDVFAGFTSLVELNIFECPKLLPSSVHKDRRWLLPRSLGELGITGDCPKTLQPCFRENLTCLKKLEVRGSPRLKYLQLYSCTALEELDIEGLGSFISLEGLQFLGSLRLMRASGCLGDHEQDGRWLLPQSLGELQIEAKCACFPENLTRLKILQVQNNPGLKSLQLTIRDCGSLDSIEGLQSLGALRHLKVFECPGLPPCFENLSSQGSELCLCPRLETLEIDDSSTLTSSFCKHLTSLQKLRYCWGCCTRLTDEQERALQLLASLKELQFVDCWNLVDLPAGLHSLPNLKRLLIHKCKGISRLPEKGLPPPLEELQIDHCSEELTDQCRKLATSKLNVKIDGKYVN